MSISIDPNSLRSGRKSQQQPAAAMSEKDNYSGVLESTLKIEAEEFQVTNQDFRYPYDDLLRLSANMKEVESQ